jgi:hypothetical protein
METDMKTKILLIGGIAAATVLAGGWALAQTQGHDHGTTVGQHAQAKGPHAKGHGQMQHQGHGQKQHVGHGKRRAQTQGVPGTTQPGATQPRAAQPGGATGSAHQH